MATTDVFDECAAALETQTDGRKTQYPSCTNHLISYGHSTTYPPFVPHELHAHERCEIFCVFRGDGYYVTEGTRHRFEHGKIILMRSGEAHRPDLLGAEPYERLALHFHPSVVDGIDPERRILAPFFDRPLGKFNVYDRSVAASTGIYELFQKMKNLRGDRYDRCLHVTSLLLAVLDELKRLFDAGLYNAPTKSSELMHSVVAFVNQNLTAELSIEQICDTFFLSRGQLNRSFKNSTGASVWDYIVTKRLMLAKTYIADGMRAGDAAAASGFGDYSAFYRAYRKKYGVNPTEQGKEPIE